MRETMEEKFAKRTIPVPEAGCTLWIGALISSGYGQIRSNGRKLIAHRVAWEMANGPIPPGMCVLHKCDTRPCVRVDHLFIGTNLQNIADKVAKGRQPKGEATGRAKLTNAQVIAIRADKRHHRVMAPEYGISRTMISYIQNRKTWKHLP